MGEGWEGENARFIGNTRSLVGIRRALLEPSEDGHFAAVPPRHTGKAAAGRPEQNNSALPIGSLLIVAARLN